MMKREFLSLRRPDYGLHTAVATTTLMPTTPINKKEAITMVSSMVIRTSTITTNITTKVHLLLASNPIMVKVVMGSCLK